jgi:hypothetical protein
MCGKEHCHGAWNKDMAFSVDSAVISIPKSCALFIHKELATLPFNAMLKASYTLCLKIP